jgi:hypothetical protein
VNEDPRLASFMTRLRSQIADAAIEEVVGNDDVAVTTFREEAFTEVLIGFLEDHGQIADAEICYLDRRLGRGIGKVNAWHCDADEGVGTLVTTIYRGLPDPTSITASELTQAVERALRVFKHAKDGAHKDMEPASCTFDMMEYLHKHAAEIDRVRIVLLADGFGSDLDKAAFGAEGVEVSIDVWDIRRFFRLDSSGLPYEPIEIDLCRRLGAPLPCLSLRNAMEDFGVYLTILPGDLLHELYHEYGPRILELNVRSFLQARGQVNRGIRDTLKSEPERFIAYNNGISATAETVEVVEGRDGLAISKVRGLQIVNGGQTVASIHRAKERDKEDLARVHVQAKLTVVGPEKIDTLVPKISRYANTQNRVSEADFSANHPFHVQLQQLSQTVWSPSQQSKWFYERARGQYDVALQREGTTPARRERFKQANPPQQKFDKVKLAKYVNAWDQLPHIVSRGGQKNFAAFMRRLQRERETSWEPDVEYFHTMIGKAIVYKASERIARLHRFPGYRANAIAYTVSLISYRTAGRVNLLAIWNNQSVSDPLAQTIQSWMPVVYEELTESADGRNVTEWCKKEECWRHLQTLEIYLHEDLQKELSDGQPLPTVGNGRHRAADSLSNEDRENIARVMQVTADVWVHIVGWGIRSGELEDWQRGIATTLASYAAGEWNYVPSRKQALHGVKILKAAEENGGMPDVEF